jgi:ABC-type dipeptide/oligopeptide/nickel transport system permease component
MGLKTLIARRILLAVPVALGVVTVIFAVLSVMTPVMRVAYFVGSGKFDLKAQNIKRLIHEYGLDQSVVVQYVNWLNKIVHLDFGRSLSSLYPPGEGPSALSVALACLPPTLELVLYSVPFIALLSTWLGTKAAVGHDKTVDHVVRVFGTLGVSLPVFVVAGLLVMLSLALQNPYHLQFMPIGILDHSVQARLGLRMEHGAFTQYTGMITVDALLNGDTSLFLNAVMHLILPVLTLVFTQCAALIRITRSGLMEELGKPYIVSAMTKGLSREEAVRKHARKNASISVLTILGLLLSNMLVSLVIVERVFGRPGFASLLVSSALTMDTPVLFTCAMLVALFFVVVNLVIDILYEYIDPRIKVE